MREWGNHGAEPPGRGVSPRPAGRHATFAGFCWVCVRTPRDPIEGDPHGPQHRDQSPRPQFDQLREQAARLATEAPLFYRQQDFFYDVPRGRLKLRRFEDGTPAELIFYQRDDRDGPKASYYTRSPVTNPDAMHALLATALTTRGIVTKERHVYLVGRTRIHLDRVDGLGDFIELEVVLGPDDDEAGGEAEAHACSRSSACRRTTSSPSRTSTC